MHLWVRAGMGMEWKWAEERGDEGGRHIVEGVMWTEG